MLREKSESPGAAGPSQQQIDDLLRLFQRGHFESTVDQARTLAQRFPGSPVLWNILGAGYGALRRPADAETAFRKSTDLNPTSYAAYRNLGGACQQQGKLDAAIEAFGQACAIKPDDPEAHFNLAKVHQQKGNLDRAVDAFGRFLAIRPDHVETHIVLGNLFKQLDRPDRAIEAYRQAIALKPDYFEVYANLGAALQLQGDLTGALDTYRQALVIKPDYAQAHYNIGVVLNEQGKVEEAIEAYRKALSFEPNYPEAHNNLGTALHDQGDTEGAIDAFRKALSISPDYAQAHNNMGVALKEQDKLDEAVSAFGEAISSKPDYAEAHNNLSVALKELGRFEEAVEASSRALSIRPGYPEAHYNMGVALNEQGKLDDAIEAYRQAISGIPDYFDAYNNMATALHDRGHLTQAVEAYGKALSIKPDSAEAKFNLAFLQLFQGDIQSGFELYEFRCQRKKATVRPARPQFAWNGESPLKGMRFFVFDEQGIGDTFQFVRYLPLLADRGADVSFKTKAKLHRILQSSHLQARLVSETLVDDQIDYEAPLMSLPHLLGTRLDTIPAPGPYLHADPGKVESWGKVFDGNRFRIGICWQGSTQKIDVGRSFPLSLFEGISKIPDIDLVSLHKGAGESQLDTIPFDVMGLGADFDAGPDAFVDCAAVMMNCDLIVTSDTAVAHLAGALGRPTWLALKHVPDWRWMKDRTDCPWYPTMVLYRQQTRGDWGSVFARMEQDLRGMIGRRS